MGRNAGFMRCRVLEYLLGAHYVDQTDASIGTALLTVIVILAFVALFIGLRLYSVLGERTGHEQQQPILKPADPDARVEPRASQPSAAVPVAADSGDMAFLPTAGPGVRAILAADPAFDVARFLEGAKGAYRLILEAFWKNDLDSVRGHVDAHVFETFAGAVEQRKKEGLTLDNRLVTIDQAVISEAEIERGVAIVAVRFEADIAAVTRNAKSEVVAGSLSDAVQTRDLWTFRRDIASHDPNWLLIETDEDE
jgi:predicted lipid-binding transport protein (Tim44 family)